MLTLALRRDVCGHLLGTLQPVSREGCVIISFTCSFIHSFFLSFANMYQASRGAGLGFQIFHKVTNCNYVPRRPTAPLSDQMGPELAFRSVTACGERLPVPA